LTRSPQTSCILLSPYNNQSTNNNLLLSYSHFLQSAADAMGKNKNATKALTQEEIWDDSALVQSWDEAVEEYRVRFVPFGPRRT
jgi:hypothetical protein